jgi:predicted  nucleic acid-binding Zn-ribbon protein
VDPQPDAHQEKSLTGDSSGDMNEISDLECQIQQLTEQCSHFRNEASESIKKSEKLEDQLTFVKGCSKMLEREIEKYEMKIQRYQSENQSQNAH